MHEQLFPEPLRRSGRPFHTPTLCAPHTLIMPRIGWDSLCLLSKGQGRLFFLPPLSLLSTSLLPSFPSPPSFPPYLPSSHPSRPHVACTSWEFHTCLWKEGASAWHSAAGGLPEGSQAAPTVHMVPLVFKERPLGLPPLEAHSTAPLGDEGKNTGASHLQSEG